MGWRTRCFGKENPSRGHCIASHSIMAVLALALYDMWNDFVPEGQLPRWGLCVSVILAALLTGWLTWLIVSGRDPR